MIIVLNHKSNLLKEEFKRYIEELKSLDNLDDIIVCPTFINIPSLCQEGIVKVGSQNISSYELGAHTGEVSAKQLLSYGVEYAIVGHSERRLSQNETSNEINQKIKKAIATGINPILCVGETEEERNNNLIAEVISKELIIALDGLTEIEKSKVIIAYEPIWSIGTGNLPTNEEITASIQIVKKIAPTSKILYGGSVNEENIQELKQLNSVNGYLIGGMSLNIDQLKTFLDRCY